MRAAIYIRVSTEEQAKEGYSVDSQTNVCQRWILDKSYDLADVYVDDGYSSKTMKRPDLQRMIRDIERQRFDLLVFWRLNRVTRTLKDKIFLFELFEKYNIGLKSMTEEIDTTTASGRMVTNLLISVAQGEREQTAENVYGTMMDRHRSGHRQGAAAPYGYDLIDGKLSVNEGQAAVIRSMFEMYASGRYGFREIAILLNRDPLKPNDGRLWTYSSVRYALMNPAYVGKLRWNYRKLSGKPTGKEVVSVGPHEPLVDELTFEKISREMRGRKTGGKAATSDYAFGGILRCGRCGRAMVGISAKKKAGRNRYYRCSTRTRNGACNMPIVADAKVHEAFLRTLDYDPAELRRFMNVKEDKSSRERAKQVEALKREIEAIQRRKKKWQIAYANDGITLDELKEHTKADKEREEELQHELQQLPEQDISSRWTEEETIEQLTRIHEVWKNSNNEKLKKTFLRDTFESITINTDTERAQGGPGNFVEVNITDFKWRP